jgi:hypothetical protein
MFVFAIGCKSKKKKSDVPAANFFVNDYLKGQVARLDSVQGQFLKIEMIDSRTDSATLTSTQAKQYAGEFLNLPDISKEEVRDDYEVSHLYDDLQEAFIFTYQTKEEHPVRLQNVTVEPAMNEQGKNEIRSIYVDYWENRNKTLTRKKFLWEANKSFEVITSIEVEGRPEKIKKLRVVWNGFDSLSTR